MEQGLPAAVVGEPELAADPAVAWAAVEEAGAAARTARAAIASALHAKRGCLTRPAFLARNYDVRTAVKR